MRFAARLLPLAAAAATLSVAAQPALAADPACAPPAAQPQGSEDARVDLLDAVRAGRAG